MMWKVTLVFAAMSLLCALPSCIPVIGADPLIITVAKNGSDEPACLEGKIACNTIDYASNVHGNGSDVTIVITYPQQGITGFGIGMYQMIRNLKLIGQGEDGYTFSCSSAGDRFILRANDIYYPKQLLLENVQILCTTLYIEGIDSVSLTGFIGHSLEVQEDVKTVHVEDSTFVYNGDLNEFKSIINLQQVYKLTFTIKNSSLITKERKGRPLAISYLFGNVSILIENTNFTLTRPPPPNQPAPMLLYFPPQSDSIFTKAFNFTISKCNFFNYSSTALELHVQDEFIIKDINIYLNILNSTFRMPRNAMSSVVNSIAVFRGWDTQANIHTRVDGNTFIPSD